jgi:hypothetical protein
MPAPIFAGFAVQTAARGLAARASISIGKRAGLATWAADFAGGGGLGGGFTIGGSLGLRQGASLASSGGKQASVLGRLHFFFQGGSITKKILLQKRYTLGSQLTRLFTNGDTSKSANNPLHGGLNGLHKVVENSLHTAANQLQPKITLDTTAFDKALLEYMKYSKKTATQVVNDKGLFIARGAIKETFKADSTTIRNDLSKPSKKFAGLNIAEAIAVSNARKQGKKRLSKSQLKSASKKVIGKKTRAVGFLRSGWIPAVKTFSRISTNKGFFGVTAGDKMSARKKGKDKGGAKPALAFIQGNVSTAELWNSIFANNDPKAMAYKYAGLQAALNKEAASMLEYVSKKQQQATDKFNSGRM